MARALYDWSVSRDGVTCTATTPGCSTDPGGTVAFATSSVWSNQAGFSGDPVLTRDPTGGLVAFVSMGFSQKANPALDSDLVVVGFSLDNGFRFGNVQEVNDRFFPFIGGTTADQPTVDMDANHTICIGWRERGGALDFHHPVLRCGTVNTTTTNVTWFNNGENIPNGSLFLQDPGGMIVSVA